MADQLVRATRKKGTVKGRLEAVEPVVAAREVAHHRLLLRPATLMCDKIRQHVAGGVEVAGQNVVATVDFGRVRHPRRLELDVGRAARVGVVLAEDAGGTLAIRASHGRRRWRRCRWWCWWCWWCRCRLEVDDHRLRACGAWLRRCRAETPVGVVRSIVTGTASLEFGRGSSMSTVRSIDELAAAS